MLAALDRGDRELRRIGEAARARALSEHTAERRAAELVDLLTDLAAANEVGRVSASPILSVMTGLDPNISRAARDSRVKPGGDELRED